MRKDSDVFFSVSQLKDEYPTYEDLIDKLLSEYSSAYPRASMLKEIAEVVRRAREKDQLLRRNSKRSIGLRRGGYRS